MSEKALKKEERALYEQVWQQVEHGFDEDRLFDMEEQHRLLVERITAPEDDNKLLKLMRQCLWAMGRGKDKARKNAEIQLVTELRKLRHRIMQHDPTLEPRLQSLLKTAIKRRHTRQTTLEKGK